VNWSVFGVVLHEIGQRVGWRVVVWRFCHGVPGWLSLPKERLRVGPGRSVGAGNGFRGRGGVHALSSGFGVGVVFVDFRIGF